MTTAGVPVPFSVTTSKAQFPVRSVTMYSAAAATEADTAMNDAATMATIREDMALGMIMSR